MMKEKIISRIVHSRPLLYLVVMLVLMISTLPVLWVYEKKDLVGIEIIISLALTPLFAEWIRSRTTKTSSNIKKDEKADIIKLKQKGIRK